MAAEVRPIVKWAGGKTRLLPHLLARVPAELRTYAEPFAGGAALFFALSAEDARGRKTFERAVLADQNQDLVACYRAVRDEVERVIDALRGYRYDRDVYYATRALDPRGMSDVERAARLVYLNRSCFNGLWRVNAKGEFNVPFGRHKNPRILDEDGLHAAAHALRKVDLRLCDYGEVTATLGEGDFVYLDPPYVPVSATASFTSYVAGGFGPGDQLRLADELARLRARGVLAMLSNADTAATRELYKDFANHVVRAPRAINSDPDGRGDTSELVVTTWGKPGVYVEDRGDVPARRAR